MSKALFLELLAEFSALKQLKLVTPEEFQNLMDLLKRGNLDELASTIIMMDVENPDDEFGRISTIIFEHKEKGGNHERRTEAVAE